MACAHGTAALGNYNLSERVPAPHFSQPHRPWRFRRLRLRLMKLGQAETPVAG